MCLFFLANQVHTNYKIIIAANRDEFYDRPAEPAKFWEENPDILAGKDIKAGGTWLGITKSGRIAAITNYRDLKNLKDNAPSRGELTYDFLNSGISPENYYQLIKGKTENYNGFNLVFGTVDNLYFFSNVEKKLIKLNKNLYGLSNCLLDTPWPKVVKVKEKFSQLLNEEKIDNKIFKILSDKAIAEDSLLPDTGIGLELERVLSSVFIKSPNYGTRNSTIIIIDYENNVKFIERTFLPGMNHSKDSTFTFTIKNS